MAISSKNKRRLTELPNLLTEEQEQMMFCAWLRLKKIPFYHTPNGGSRHIIEATKMRRMGVSPGVPDICIPIPNEEHHALYIELKRKRGGKVEKHQQVWIDRLIELGNLAVVAKGASEAIEITEKYLQTARH